MNKPHPKMPASERAKQFMPFAALRGLNEALAAMEETADSRKILSDEMSDELDAKLHSLYIGSTAEIVFYSSKKYIKISGIITKISMQNRSLTISDVTIPFDDIIDASAV